MWPSPQIHAAEPSSSSVGCFSPTLQISRPQSAAPERRTAPALRALHRLQCARVRTARLQSLTGTGRGSKGGKRKEQCRDPSRALRVGAPPARPLTASRRSTV
ncbi:hypothetical protein NDU88_008064 [Pleurodeles waltl]|uniref:Uncharacterized protein n=1 Tax=Pleurodeles waltl TaxID=8319 RepID=A0AAV7PN84_PLEWA|nr:hypothetical protein NDU88_008064 [Pleurodeles waltl]